MYTLVVRPGCHLCEQAEQSLAALEEERGLVWRAVDIDTDPDFAQYSDDLPVLLSDGRPVARLTSSKAALARATRPHLWKRILHSLHLN
ncbi:glutaredoxin family protein [Flaviflexus huanghaiensis]|uniref:glutaredoxin family protein n=1 Tax=Flaviflexus huanghaiensis TaxID=1111473 RepID=UPI0015FA9A4E|nr:glutaredoxin family protein [Flaviflexus huanghaiensis]